VRTVLVVDDDRDIRESLAGILVLEGFPVACVANGHQALQWLLSNHAQPCVVLLDLMMPVMDGEAFLASRETNRALPDFPVIVMTAGCTPPQAMRQYDIEASIPKPIDLDRLLTTLAKIAAT
jgi:two-component system, chemotaxis family, chemotaxis protein CheY